MAEALAYTIIQVRCNASLLYMSNIMSYINSNFYFVGLFEKPDKVREKVLAITVGLYRKLVVSLTLNLHSSGSGPTLISNSLSTGCLQIGHLFVWNLKTFAQPLHIHYKKETNPAKVYQQFNVEKK